MSWISDITGELKSLDTSKKSIRKFAWLVGGIFTVLGFFWNYKHGLETTSFIFYAIGCFLLVFGTIIPRQISFIYKLWMGLAFVMGWFVSRILLSILFYLVFTPIGLLMRALGKRPLNLNFQNSQVSYWIYRDNSKKSDYKRMF